MSFHVLWSSWNISHARYVVAGLARPPIAVLLTSYKCLVSAVDKLIEIAQPLVPELALSTVMSLRIWRQTTHYYIDCRSDAIILDSLLLTHLNCSLYCNCTIPAQRQAQCIKFSRVRRHKVWPVIVVCL